MMTMKIEPRNHPQLDEKPHIVVRPMSTLGRYWTTPIDLEDAHACLVDGLMFTACRHRPRAKEREYYTEFDDLLDVELQFFAAMILAVGFDEGMVVPYPAPESFATECRGDLSGPAFQDAAAIAIRNQLKRAPRPATAPDIPLRPRDRRYEFHHLPLDMVRLARIFRGIDSTDDLLMRGLQALLKSLMISRHAQFTEEASYSLYVSLDALFSLTRRHLVSSGLSNPSSYDAQAFIHDLFQEEQSGTRFFEDFYNDRLMSVHPDNRYGVFRHAPISHCDVYTLSECLRDVYRQMVLLNGDRKRVLLHSV
jgi:hypothetical protein